LLVLKGTTGAGKSMLGLIMTDIYGEANCSDIGNRELGATFNGFMAHKQFIVCEEIKGNGNIRPDSEAIKQWVTGEKALINEKYEKERPIKNFTNFIFISNDRLPLFMAGNDRRYVVVDIPNKFGDARGEALLAWSRGGGASFVRHYLEHDVDFAGFSPTADSKGSAAKTDVINAGRSAIERFAHTIMKEGDRPTFISKQDLYRMADKQLSIGRGKDTQLGNALREAGAFCIRDRFRVSTKVRNTKDDIWRLRGTGEEKISDDALRATLESERSQRLAFMDEIGLDEIHAVDVREQERLAAEEAMAKRARDAERELSYYKHRCYELSEKERNREFRDRMKEIDKANKKTAKVQLKKDAEAAKQQPGKEATD
jgi:hypothetical protein